MSPEKFFAIIEKLSLLIILFTVIGLIFIPLFPWISYTEKVSSEKDTKEKEEIYNLESKHPYQNNYDNNWTIEKRGVSKIRVYFERIDLGSGDEIIVMNKKNLTIQIYNSTNANFINSSWIYGETIKIRLKSDSSDNSYGFKITKIYYSISTVITTNYISKQEIDLNIEYKELKEDIAMITLSFLALLIFGIISLIGIVSTKSNKNLRAFGYSLLLFSNVMILFAFLLLFYHYSFINEIQNFEEYNFGYNYVPLIIGVLLFITVIIYILVILPFILKSFKREVKIIVKQVVPVKEKEICKICSQEINEKSIKCSCGSVYHESCAIKVGECIICKRENA